MSKRPITMIELSDAEPSSTRFAPVLEQELLPALRHLAHRLPGATASLVLAPEFRGARGVVDLLAVTGALRGLAERAGAGPPFYTSESASSALALLSERQTRSAAQVARRLGVSDERVEVRMNALIRSGAVLRDGRGYRRRGGLAPAGRAYALEAKVNDWRRGLAQALRYSTWADASAVVLLREPVEMAAVAERFSDLRVGLAVGSRWVIRPRLQRPMPGRRLALAERLAERLHADALIQ